MTDFSVAKFGGTSMGSPDALWNAAGILKRDGRSRLVVVSATSGTTNQLLRLAEAEFAGDQNAGDRIAGEIRDRHLTLSQAVGVVVSAFSPLFRELEDVQRMLRDAQASGLTQQARLLDLLLSLGERLAAELFCSVLKAEGRSASTFDARRVLRTDGTFGRAEPDLRAIASLARQILLPEMEKHEVIVTQGFIGGAPGGHTTTLGRGGSDYSAALFGEALGAGSVHIWTDVPGVFTMDPSVVPGARPIAELSFAEAAELANFGAKVLHPATLLPAMRANIPVFVGSTFSTGEDGTWIRNECSDLPLARAVALRKRQTLLTVTSLRMLNAQGFLARMFQTLAEHNLSVDLVTTSEVSVALTIDSGSLGSGARPVAENYALLDELRSFSELTVEEDLTLVALIGNRLNTTPGIGARVLQAVAPENIRLVCHGASAQNVCFLVRSDAAAGVVQRLHKEFLEAGKA
jgi:aspartate kinase